MTQPTIAARRLLNQRIAGEKAPTPEAAVAWMGALQAQEYHQGVWAAGLRTAAGRLAEVERAIAEGKIARTWPMRGTLHFVPVEDAGWMTAISAERMLAGARTRRRQLGIEDAALEGSARVFEAALSGGRLETRGALMERLEQAGISTEGQRGYHLLWHAAQNGLICVGPNLGKQQSFAWLTDWAARPRRLSREEGLGELARRFFRSHGPATQADFAWWAGLTGADVRKGLEAAREDLTSETIEGSEYWSGAPGRDLAVETDRVHLLAGFDEYLLGYTERGAVLAKEHADRVAPGANGLFKPILVVGGAVAGTWQRAVKKKQVEINCQVFGGVEVPKAGLEAAALGYAEFLGLALGGVRIE